MKNNTSPSSSGHSSSVDEEEVTTAAAAAESGSDNSSSGSDSEDEDDLRVSYRDAILGDDYAMLASLRGESQLFRNDFYNTPISNTYSSLYWKYRENI